MDPPEHSGRVEQACWEFTGVVWRAKAEHIGVGNGAGTKPSSEDVAVDADYPGYRSTKRVQRAWGVVRLGLHAQAPIVVPCDDSGVVMEHAQKPIDLLLDIEGRSHDVGFE